MIERVYVTSKELLEISRHLSNERTYYTASGSSVYVPSKSIKYIDKAVCKLWLDGEGYNMLMTPGEAARAELQREWPDLKRVGWNKLALPLFDKRPPLHYSGASEGDMTYIDLKSAYHQIYKHLWLDVSWPCGLYGGLPLCNVADRLKAWKAARNAVVGLCRSRTIVGVRGAARKELSVTNKFLSPALWGTVMDILHWVAREALACGAIYINTDGYLFPMMGTELDPFLVFLMENGLLFETRAQGRGEIKSWNAYRIGPFKTAPYKLNLDTSSRSFSNVYKTTKTWGAYWGRLRRIYSTRTKRQTNGE